MRKRLANFDRASSDGDPERKEMSLKLSDWKGSVGCRLRDDSWFLSEINDLTRLCRR